MAFVNDHKEDYTCAAASPSPSPLGSKTSYDYDVPLSQDIEKAEPNLVPRGWTYGTFSLRDTNVSEISGEKTRERRLGAFNVVVFSLIASLLLVGIFAVMGVGIVTAIME